MIRKVIKYKDLDGNPRVEDFYFNLTKTELIKMEIGRDGGLAEHLKKITESGNNKDILEVFESIILGAYGKRSEDGVRFIKSPEISKEFTQTDAYEELLFEFMTDAASAAAFINSLIPDDMEARMKELMDSADLQLPDGDAVKTIGDYSEAELLSMDQSEFDKVAGVDPQKMSREIMLVAFKRRSRTDPVT